MRQHAGLDLEPHRLIASRRARKRQLNQFPRFRRRHGDAGYCRKQSSDHEAWMLASFEHNLNQ
jgi:hypothetical protein